MSGWTFDYAMEQARLALKDSGKLYSHGFVCDVLDPIINEIDNERKQRVDNPGVWDYAPKDSDFVQLWYFKKPAKGDDFIAETSYTRTLPKTKAREIAEKTMSKIKGTPCIEWTNAIERAILEYEKQTKGE